MAPHVKICGLREATHIRTAVEAGADYLGLMFYPLSPRALSPETAANLLLPLRDTIRKADVQIVAVMVNPDDALLHKIVTQVQPDLLQFHGNETPERLEEIRHVFDEPIIKALPIASKKDLEAAAAYQNVADYLLLDTPAPEGVHGGTGKPFDWQALKDWEAPLPYLLAGGLNADNVSEAIQTCQPYGVDVSSGVEHSRGQKDNDAIRAFLAAAKGIK